MSIDTEWKPEILLADNAPAIHQGFIKACGQPTIINWRVNCWAHAIRNIDDELKCVVNKMNRSEMREDIIRIQLVYTEKLFEAATKLSNKGKPRVRLEVWWRQLVLIS